LFGQMMVVLVDKLVRMQLTDCSAVINWLFSKDMKENFTKYVNYLLLSSVEFYCKEFPCRKQS